MMDGEQFSNACACGRREADPPNEDCERCRLVAALAAARGGRTLFAAELAAARAERDFAAGQWRAYLVNSLVRATNWVGTTETIEATLRDIEAEADARIAAGLAVARAGAGPDTPLTPAPTGGRTP